MSVAPGYSQSKSTPSRPYCSTTETTLFGKGQAVGGGNAVAEDRIRVGVGGE